MTEVVACVLFLRAGLGEHGDDQDRRGDKQGRAHGFLAALHDNLPSDDPLPAKRRTDLGNAGPLEASTVFFFSWNEITFGKLLDLLRETFEIYQLAGK